MAPLETLVLGDRIRQVREADEDTNESWWSGVDSLTRVVFHILSAVSLQMGRRGHRRIFRGCSSSRQSQPSLWQRRLSEWSRPSGGCAAAGDAAVAPGNPGRHLKRKRTIVRYTSTSASSTSVFSETASPSSPLKSGWPSAFLQCINVDKAF